MRESDWLSKRPPLHLTSRPAQLSPRLAGKHEPRIESAAGLLLAAPNVGTQESKIEEGSSPPVAAWETSTSYAVPAFVSWCGGEMRAAKGS